MGAEKNQYRDAFPEGFPQQITIDNTLFEKIKPMKYGENPGMPAALYKEIGATGPGIAEYEILQENPEKKLGFINVLDLNASLKIVKRIKKLFPEYTTASVSKHDGPSGTARADSVIKAYNDAWDADSLSAFGGIVAFSDTVDEETAKLMTTRFFECVIAPGYTDDALEALQKKKDVRVVRVPSLDTELVDNNYQYIKLDGGLLVQKRYESKIDSPENLRTVSKRQPTADELQAALFNWAVTGFTPSNSIILGTPYRTVGIGAGQRSRIDSARLAIYYANTKCKGASSKGTVMASDAFFPFRDSIDLAGISGVTATQANQQK
ncbi:MAG: hypothetical protein NT120_04095 [Candidatus Aenigmarchaeota archaeon]|nr:hypothetical protein [Candidatus Aenigmarchaeota archaeon]